MTEQLRPENRGIRLVEADEVPMVTRNKDGDVLFFVTEAKHPPETQDLFHSIQLTGERLTGQQSGFPMMPGQLTAIGNTLMSGDAYDLPDGDLCYIGIEVEPGFRGPGKALRCDMYIEGFETYYTCIMDNAEDDSYSYAEQWQSSDPTDPERYQFLASSHDTALLSRLLFSFHVVPDHSNDITR